MVFSGELLPSVVEIIFFDRVTRPRNLLLVEISEFGDGLVALMPFLTESDEFDMLLKMTSLRCISPSEFFICCCAGVSSDSYVSHTLTLIF